MSLLEVRDKLEGLPHAIFDHFLLGFLQLLELGEQSPENILQSIGIFKETSSNGEKLSFGLLVIKNQELDDGATDKPKNTKLLIDFMEQFLHRFFYHSPQQSATAIQPGALATKQLL